MEIEQTLIDRIAELAELAQSVVDDFWQFHVAHNHPLKPKEKGRLNCWVRLRGDNLEIFWTRFVFTHSKSNDGKTGVRSIHIPKGRKSQYARASLQRHAKDWEIEKVMEAEKKLAAIRSEYTEIKKTLFYLKRMHKAKNKINELMYVNKNPISETA